jgi:hypothetical protein
MNINRNNMNINNKNRILVNEDNIMSKLSTKLINKIKNRQNEIINKSLIKNGFNK